MSDIKFDQPQTFYTRLNDILEEDKYETKEDFCPSNVIRTNFLPRKTGNKSKEREASLQKKEKEDLLKPRYVNKELVESWIDAINMNSHEIENYKSCIRKVKNEFNLRPQLFEKMKITNNKREEMEINDTNFLKTVGERVIYYKEHYFDKNDDNNDKKNRNGLKFNTFNIHDKNKEKSKINNNNKKHHVFKKRRKNRRFEILKKNLDLMKDNGVTLDQVIKNNPFQTKPFERKGSIELIDAVKYDKFEELEALLKNPDLLFSFDYFHQTAFHWAAKRSKYKAVRTMVAFAKCVNLTDINHMTPLAIAAKNDDYEMCELLCSNGANPYIRNNEGKKPVDLTEDIKLRTYLLLVEDNFLKQL